MPDGPRTAIFPLVAPVGTVTVRDLSPLTLKVVAGTGKPLKVTPSALVKPVPVSVTEVPTAPLSRDKDVMTGRVVVKPENVYALMAEQDIDGALVGGASLDPVSFARIVRFDCPEESQ